MTTLLSSHHEIVAVYTKPDSPAGRGKKLTASPVKMLAIENDIAIYQPTTLKSEESQRELATIDADIMVVVAYGLILPKVALAIPRLGCINIHGSILPRWRGAAPIQRAILAGDEQTGVTIIQMNEGLDSGDILKITTLNIADKETSGTLYERLAVIGTNMLISCLDNISAGSTVPKKQDDKLANYAKKLSKSEALIDWTLSAVAIDRCIRAFNPWPMSYFLVGKNNIKVWDAEVEMETSDKTPGTILSVDKMGIRVATGDGVLRLTSLQPPGKKTMSITDIINSRLNWFEPTSTL
ncbi:Methionyl-tRNA formyltransferase [Candidatus Enterovibrio escicola]|uniref:Methionyl-tRNA formyltransferase n=2 Tax=Candidatus Enterovibrio escicola TaxID=1927127 RepID=A0A2A5T5A4_9GAMM|nr:Methionyl-tRNA formyltransferase [Candidatus Enterovibrio escacola]